MPWKVSPARAGGKASSVRTQTMATSALTCWVDSYAEPRCLLGSYFKIPAMSIPGTETENIGGAGGSSASARTAA